MSHSQETHAVSLRAISHIYAGGTPDKKATRYWENGSIPWVNSGTVNQGLVTRPSAFISEEAFENSSTSWARKGDLIVALAGQGQTKGKVAQMGMDACVNQSMAVIHIRETSNFVPRFAYYAIHSQYRDIRFMAGGDKRDGLNLQHIGAIRIPYPPFGTQQRIADYLDRETAEIDAAVADLDKYVELLEKRRRVIIVDGFNDPVYNPVMQRLKFLTISEDHRRIPIKSGDRVDMAGKYPYYGASGIIDYVNDYLWDGEKRLILSEDGANLVMRNHPVAFVADGQYWVNNHAHVLKCADGIPPELVAMAIEVTSIAHLITGSAQPKLTAAAMGEVEFMFPLSTADQRALLETLRPEMHEIDSLIADSTRLRDLLLKRRSVLITEVVTGRKQV